MSKFLLSLFFVVAMAAQQGRAAEAGKTVVTTPSNQILSCDASADASLAKMNEAIKELRAKATTIENFVREVQGFENAIFPVKTAIGENMRNVFELRVFIYAPMIWGQVRAAMAAGSHAAPFPADMLGTATEKTIKFPYGSCVRLHGDAKPLL